MFSAFFVWLFAHHELAHPEPLLDLRRVAGRAVAPTHRSARFVGIGAVGVTAVIAQFVQVPATRGYGFGADATHAGLFLLPAALAVLATSALSSRLIALAGARTALLADCAFAATGLGCSRSCTGRASSSTRGPCCLMTGSGFAFPALPNLVLAGALVASRSGGEAGYAHAFALERLGCVAAFACGLTIPRDRLRERWAGPSRR